MAEADPTVEWHVANATLTGLDSTRLDAAARAEIYADGRFPYGNGAAPVGRATPVDGGYRLTGRWPFVTGVEHAQWNLLAAIVVDSSADARPPVTGGYGSAAAQVFLVPNARISIERTWDCRQRDAGHG